MNDAKDKIRQLDLYTLKIVTVTSILGQVAEILREHPELDEHLDDAEFQSLATQLQSSLVPKRRFTQTERLKIANDYRLTILTAIWQNVKSHAIMPNDNQDSAKRLRRILKTRRITQLKRSSYPEISGYLPSLIDHLRNEDNLEHLEKFPTLVAWLSLLEQANNDFEAIMQEKFEEIDLDFVSATKIRKKIIPVYKTLVEKLEAHATIGTAPGFNKVIAEINATIIGDHL